MKQLLSDSLSATDDLDALVNALGFALSASGLAALKGSPTEEGGNMLALLSTCRSIKERLSLFHVTYLRTSMYVFAHPKQV